MMTEAGKVYAAGKGELGFLEGVNNQQKYSPEVPGLEWSQNQAWCQTFQSWIFREAGLAELAPVTASCSSAVDWFKRRNRFSGYPATGAQVFFGSGGGSHVAFVYAYDDTYIYTVEGNTNADGSSEGDGVYSKRRERRDGYVFGYGYPDYIDGIVTADPTPDVEGATYRATNTLDVPAEQPRATHTVVEGDTLASIADLYGLTINELLSLNLLHVGEVLVVGGPVTPQPPAPDPEPQPPAPDPEPEPEPPAPEPEPEPEPEPPPPPPAPKPEPKPPAPPAPYAPPPFPKGLRPGSANPSAKPLQRALKADGYMASGAELADNYGPMTQGAVAAFYAAHPDLSTGGYDPAIGPMGWAQLHREAYGGAVKPKPPASSAGEPAHNYGRTSYGGRTVNQRTKVMLQDAASKFGSGFSLTQGSYNTGVGASAGTHDGGGVVDISVSGMSSAGRKAAVQALRKAGMAAWLRTPADGFAYHIHAVAIGDREMSSAAKSQIRQWAADTNGLANHGHDSEPDPYPAWTQQYR